jgi:beta-galactosidase
MRQFKKYSIFMVLCMGFASFSFSQDLSQDWRFIKQEEPVNAPTDHWDIVSIPHTWNAVDAQNGGGKDPMSRDGYYRGPATYAKTFIAPKSCEGKRLFLRFEAVSSVAEVYLNGINLGKHMGAFGAFAFEITPYLKPGQPNDLRVLANNAWREDLPPLAGDFPVFGGIYRPVHILIEEPVCISPLQRGSHGVFLRQQNVSPKEATLTVSSLISNGRSAATDVSITYAILDKAGKTVGTVTDRQHIGAKADSTSTASLKLSNPHLWDGRMDPYLYTVKVTVNEGGKTVDSYTCKQGFRFFKVDGEKGFFLNGKSYQLWGINRHQDHEGRGWALTNKEHDIDLALIDEMGTRAIRLAHYPHSEYFYQRCDELGILVSAELPLVDCIRDTDAFTKNTTLQMNEIIDMYANYTCVFTYGLYNEMYHKKSPPAEDLLTAMHDLCKQRDPSRFTYGGTNKGADKKELNTTTELLAFNGYTGWYWSDSSGMKREINNYLRLNGHRGIAISEYGAGASIKHQETYPKKPRPGGKWHPEGYQAIQHEVQFEIMKKNPQVWGTFLWNMFDFCSVWRNEGDRPGINDKGLVTHDRKTRKDAFMFYKANWNTKNEAPVLYITSRRHTLRVEKTTPIKVYSNVGPVTLTVNGATIGTKEPTDMQIVTWDNVELKAGENTIKVTAGEQGDSCKWTVKEGAQAGSRASTDSGQDSDNPKLAFDGKMGTRWTTSKKGSFLTKTFPESVTAEIIAIAWYKGDERTYKFEMQISNDKKTWETIFNGESVQLAADLSRYEVPKSTFKHLRIKCNGNNMNSWSSIWEIQCPSN